MVIMEHFSDFETTFLIANIDSAVIQVHTKWIPGSILWSEASISCCIDPMYSGKCIVVYFLDVVSSNIVALSKKLQFCYVEQYWGFSSYLEYFLNILLIVNIHNVSRG